MESFAHKEDLKENKDGEYAEGIPDATRKGSISRLIESSLLHWTHF